MIRQSLSFFAALAIGTLSIASSPTPADAQFGKKLKEALKQRGKDKVINKAGEEQDKGIDTVAERIKSTIGGKGEKKSNTATGRQKVTETRSLRPTTRPPRAEPTTGGSSW
jgi:hypothetical protein